MSRVGDDEMNERHGEIKKLARKGPVQGALYIISSLVAFYAVARCVMAAFDWLAGGSSASEEDSEVAQATLPALVAFISGNLARAMVPSTKHGIPTAGEARFKKYAIKTAFNTTFCLLYFFSGYLTRKGLFATFSWDGAPASLIVGFGLALTSVIIANVVERPRKQQKKIKHAGDVLMKEDGSEWNPYFGGIPSTLAHVAALSRLLNSVLFVPLSHEMLWRVFLPVQLALSASSPVTAETAQSVGMLYAAGLIILYGMTDVRKQPSTAKLASFLTGLGAQWALYEYGIGAAILVHASRNFFVGVYVLLYRDWRHWAV